MTGILRIVAGTAQEGADDEPLSVRHWLRFVAMNMLEVDVSSVLASSPPPQLCKSTVPLYSLHLHV